jgi:hypothetical protein
LNYDKKPRLEANPAGFSVESATLKNGAIGTYVQNLNGLLRKCSNNTSKQVGDADHLKGLPTPFVSRSIRCPTFSDAACPQITIPHGTVEALIGANGIPNITEKVMSVWQAGCRVYDKRPLSLLDWNFAEFFQDHRTQLKINDDLFRGSVLRFRRRKMK